MAGTEKLFSVSAKVSIPACAAAPRAGGKSKPRMSVQPVTAGSQHGCTGAASSQRHAPSTASSVTRPGQQGENPDCSRRGVDVERQPGVPHARIGRGNRSSSSSPKTARNASATMATPSQRVRQLLARPGQPECGGEPNRQRQQRRRPGHDQAVVEEGPVHTVLRVVSTHHSNIHHRQRAGFGHRPPQFHVRAVQGRGGNAREIAQLNFVAAAWCCSASSRAPR